MGKEKIVRIELGKGDDRFTEYREGKAVIKPYVEMVASLQPVADKLAFVEDLCADSLDVYQIIMGIEDAFEIRIPASEAEKITPVKEAVELIKRAEKG